MSGRIKDILLLQMEKWLLELADLAREVPALDAGLRTRLADDLTPLYWERIRAAEGQPACPQCQGPYPILTSASKRNPGRQYQTCWFCDEFNWADDNGAEGLRNPLAQLGFSTPGTDTVGNRAPGGTSPATPGPGGGSRLSQYAPIFHHWQSRQT